MGFRIQWFWCVCVIGWGMVSIRLANASLNPSLIPPKDVMALTLSEEAHFGNNFFDNNRNRLKLETVERTDWATQAQFEYSLTNFLSIFFNFPLVYRGLKNSENILDATSYGLGDVDFFLNVQPIHWPWLTVKPFYGLTFPTGTTTIGETGLTEVPLGQGNVVHHVGFEIQSLPLSVMGFRVSGEYRINKKTVAEYLPVRAIDPNGLPVVLGNQAIDYGDEIRGGATVMGIFRDELTVEVRGEFIYRRPTYIEQQLISYMDSDPTTSTSSGYLGTITPRVSYNFSESFTIAIQNSIPVLGKRYPIVDLYQTDSLLGWVNPSLSVTYLMD